MMGISKPVIHKDAQFHANFQLTHIAPCLQTLAVSQLVNNIYAVITVFTKAHNLPSVCDTTP
jgi:hypothetical protein